MLFQYVTMIAGIMGVVLFLALPKGSLKIFFLFVGLVSIFIYMWPIYKAYKIENGEINQKKDLRGEQKRIYENVPHQTPSPYNEKSSNKIEPQRNGEIWVTNNGNGERIVIPSIGDMFQKREENGDTVFGAEENKKPKPGDTVF